MMGACVFPMLVIPGVRSFYMSAMFHKRNGSASVRWRTPGDLGSIRVFGRAHIHIPSRERAMSASHLRRHSLASIDKNLHSRLEEFEVWPNTSGDQPSDRSGAKGTRAIVGAGNRRQRKAATPYQDSSDAHVEYSRIHLSLTPPAASPRATISTTHHGAHPIKNPAARRQPSRDPHPV